MTKATELVRARGASAFAMRELARHLGCEPAALYHYVASKEDVLAAVATEMADAFINPVIALASDRVSAQRLLVAAVQRLLQLAEDEPHVWDLLFLDRRVAPIGCRIRLRLQDHLAALAARWADETHHPWSADSARLAAVVLTMAIGEGTLRACRPNLVGCRVSAWQIVGLFAQPKPHVRAQNP